MVVNTNNTSYKTYISNTNYRNGDFNYKTSQSLQTYNNTSWHVRDSVPQGTESTVTGEEEPFCCKCLSKNEPHEPEVRYNNCQQSTANMVASYGVYYDSGLRSEDEDGFIPRSNAYRGIVVNASGGTSVLHTTEARNDESDLCVWCVANQLPSSTTSNESWWISWCKPTILLLILVLLVVMFVLVSGILLYFNYAASIPRPQIGEEPCEKTFCNWGGQCMIGSDGRPFCQCPLYCKPFTDPVCGTDGRTYENECQLQVASCKARLNTKIKYAGECEQTDPCRDKQCGFGARCVPTPDGHNFTCQCPEKCPNYGDHVTSRPVCGSDGIDYKDQCDLQKSACTTNTNITLKFFGKCDPCAGVECAEPEICQLDEHRNPVCRCGESCPLEFTPVCGSDGKTYQNECLLRQEACRARKVLNIIYRGKCSSGTASAHYSSNVSGDKHVLNMSDENSSTKKRKFSCDQTDSDSDFDLEFPTKFLRFDEDSEPTKRKWDSDESDDEIPSKIYCGGQGINPCTSVHCVFGEECTINKYGIARCECPPTCEHIMRPVCTKDSRTFPSECELKRSACLTRTAIEVAYTGVCGDMGPCTNHQCPFGAICVERSNSAHCECTPCPEEFEPVCGSDGISYGNECKLRQEACKHHRQIRVLYDGPCNDCENKKCDFYSTCETDGGTEGRCVCPLSCNDEKLNDTPVCGTDGVTYPKECDMRMAACKARQHVQVAYKGNCDLCKGVKCKFGGRCHAGECVCPTNCEGSGDEPVCASNMVTYPNECELQKAACLQPTKATPLSVVFYGDCRERFPVTFTTSPAATVQNSTEAGSETHTEATDSFTGLTGLDRNAAEREACRDIHCDYDATCELGPDNFPRCICQFDCANNAGPSKPVCASDLRMYSSLCAMKMEACQRQEELRLRPLELCQGMEVKPCNGEVPLSDPSTNKELDCGNGPNRQDCPSGSYCHQTARFAKCCQKDQSTSQKKSCEDSWFGCCPDNKTPAQGIDNAGCPSLCGCNKLGSYSDTCDAETKECRCKPGVGGAKCDRCEPGYWGLPKISSGHQGCTPCGCSSFGSVREDCEQMTGRCVCKPGIQGQKCTVCTSHDKVLSPSGCVEAIDITTPFPTSCDEKECHSGADCVEKGGTATCECRTGCPEEANPQMVCGSDGQTYSSPCHLRAVACKRQRDIVVQAFGACTIEDSSTDLPVRRYTPIHFTQPDDSNSLLSKSTRHLAPDTRYYERSGGAPRQPQEAANDPNSKSSADDNIESEESQATGYDTAYNTRGENDNTIDNDNSEVVDSNTVKNNTPLNTDRSNYIRNALESSSKPLDMPDINDYDNSCAYNSPDKNNLIVKNDHVQDSGALQDNCSQGDNQKSTALQTISESQEENNQDAACSDPNNMKNYVLAVEILNELEAETNSQVAKKNNDNAHSADETNFNNHEEGNIYTNNEVNSNSDKKAISGSDSGMDKEINTGDIEQIKQTNDITNAGVIRHEVNSDITDKNLREIDNSNKRDTNQEMDFSINNEARIKQNNENTDSTTENEVNFANVDKNQSKGNKTNNYKPTQLEMNVDDTFDKQVARNNETSNANDSEGEARDVTSEDMDLDYTNKRQLTEYDNNDGKNRLLINTVKNDHNYCKEEIDTPHESDNTEPMNGSNDCYSDDSHNKRESNIVIDEKSDIDKNSDKVDNSNIIDKNNSKNGGENTTVTNNNYDAGGDCENMFKIESKCNDGRDTKEEMNVVNKDENKVNENYIANYSKEEIDTRDQSDNTDPMNVGIDEENMYGSNDYNSEDSHNERESNIVIDEKSDIDKNSDKVDNINTIDKNNSKNGGENTTVENNDNDGGRDCENMFKLECNDGRDTKEEMNVVNKDENKVNEDYIANYSKEKIDTQDLSDNTEPMNVGIDEENMYRNNDYNSHDSHNERESNIVIDEKSDIDKNSDKVDNINTIDKNNSKNGGENTTVKNNDNDGGRDCENMFKLECNNGRDTKEEMNVVNKDENKVNEDYIANYSKEEIDIRDLSDNTDPMSVRIDKENMYGSNDYNSHDSHNERESNIVIDEKSDIDKNSDKVDNINTTDKNNSKNGGENTIVTNNDYGARGDCENMFKIESKCNDGKDMKEEMNVVNKDENTINEDYIANYSKKEIDTRDQSDNTDPMSVRIDKENIYESNDYNSHDSHNERESNIVIDEKSDIDKNSDKVDNINTTDKNNSKNGGENTTVTNNDYGARGDCENMFKIESKCNDGKDMKEEMNVVNKDENTINEDYIANYSKKEIDTRDQSDNTDPMNVGIDEENMYGSNDYNSEDSHNERESNIVIDEKSDIEKNSDKVDNINTIDKNNSKNGGENTTVTNNNYDVGGDCENMFKIECNDGRDMKEEMNVVNKDENKVNEDYIANYSKEEIDTWDLSDNTEPMNVGIDEKNMYGSNDYNSHDSHNERESNIVIDEKSDIDKNSDKVDNINTTDKNNSKNGGENTIVTNNDYDAGGDCENMFKIESKCNDGRDTNEEMNVVNKNENKINEDYNNNESDSDEQSKYGRRSNCSEKSSNSDKTRKGNKTAKRIESSSTKNSNKTKNKSNDGRDSKEEMSECRDEIKSNEGYRDSETENDEEGKCGRSSSCSNKSLNSNKTGNESKTGKRNDSTSSVSDRTDFNNEEPSWFRSRIHSNDSSTHRHEMDSEHSIDVANKGNSTVTHEKPNFSSEDKSQFSDSSEQRPGEIRSLNQNKNTRVRKRIGENSITSDRRSSDADDDKSRLEEQINGNNNRYSKLTMGETRDNVDSGLDDIKRLKEIGDRYISSDTEQNTYSNDENQVGHADISDNNDEGDNSNDKNNTKKMYVDYIDTGAKDHLDYSNHYDKNRVSKNHEKSTCNNADLHVNTENKNTSEIRKNDNNGNNGITASKKDDFSVNKTVYLKDGDSNGSDNKHSSKIDDEPTDDWKIHDKNTTENSSTSSNLEIIDLTDDSNKHTPRNRVTSKSTRRRCKTTITSTSANSKLETIDLTLESEENNDNDDNMNVTSSTTTYVTNYNKDSGSKMDIDNENNQGSLQTSNETTNTSNEGGSEIRKNSKNDPHIVTSKETITYHNDQNTDIRPELVSDSLILDLSCKENNEQANDKSITDNKYLDMLNDIIYINKYNPMAVDKLRKSVGKIVRKYKLDKQRSNCVDEYTYQIGGSKYNDDSTNNTSLNVNKVNSGDDSNRLDNSNNNKNTLANNPAYGSTCVNNNKGNNTESEVNTNKNDEGVMEQKLSNNTNNVTASNTNVENMFKNTNKNNSNNDSNDITAQDTNNDGKCDPKKRSTKTNNLGDESLFEKIIQNNNKDKDAQEDLTEMLKASILEVILENCQFVRTKGRNHEKQQTDTTSFRNIDSNENLKLDNQKKSGVSKENVSIAFQNSDKTIAVSTHIHRHTNLENSQNEQNYHIPNKNYDSIITNSATEGYNRDYSKNYYLQTQNTTEKLVASGDHYHRNNQSVNSAFERNYSISVQKKCETITSSNYSYRLHHQSTSNNHSNQSTSNFHHLIDNADETSKNNDLIYGYNYSDRQKKYITMANSGQSWQLNTQYSNSIHDQNVDERIAGNAHSYLRKPQDSSDDIENSNCISTKNPSYLDYVYHQNIDTPARYLLQDARTDNESDHSDGTNNQDNSDDNQPKETRAQNNAEENRAKSKSYYIPLQNEAELMGRININRNDPVDIADEYNTFNNGATSVVRHQIFTQTVQPNICNSRTENIPTKFKNSYAFYYRNEANNNSDTIPTVAGHSHHRFSYNMGNESITGTDYFRECNNQAVVSNRTHIPFNQYNQLNPHNVSDSPRMSTAAVIRNNVNPLFSTQFNPNNLRRVNGQLLSIPDNQPPIILPNALRQINPRLQNPFDINRTFANIDERAEYPNHVFMNSDVDNDTRNNH